MGENTTLRQFSNKGLLGLRYAVVACRISMSTPSTSNNVSFLKKGEGFIFIHHSATLDEYGS